LSIVNGLQTKAKNKEVTSQYITMTVNWKKDEELYDSIFPKRIRIKPHVFSGQTIGRTKM